MASHGILQHEGMGQVVDVLAGACKVCEFQHLQATIERAASQADTLHEFRYCACQRQIKVYNVVQIAFIPFPARCSPESASSGHTQWPSHHGL